MRSQPPSDVAEGQALLGPRVADRVRELKTWISEDTGPEATVDALLSVIAYFRIPRGRANKLLGPIEAAVSRWRQTGLSLGMTKQELARFADAFEHRERDAARQAAKQGN